MQSLSAKGCQGVAGLWGEQARLGPESGAVGGVPQDWMPQMRQMHADLMGASGLQGAGEQAGDRGPGAGRGETFEHLPMGDGRTPVAADRLLVARLRVAAEWSVDGAFRLSGCAPDDCDIAAPERAFAFLGKLLRQCAVRLVGLRYNHEAGRVLVQAVNNSWPLDPANARQAIAAMRNQRIDQRTARVAGGGVDDQIFRFVDHDDRVVLVNDI